METRVSHRYAKSLLDLSLEKGQLEQVYEDMQVVQSTIRQSHELSVLLNSPIIKTDKKQDILKAIFGGNIGVITSSFIDIISRKRREGELLNVAESFIAQYKKHKNILTAVITTASGLDANIRAKVMEIVKATAKSDLQLVEKVDKDLIGGFVLRIGDKQVDSSIMRQIRDLERNFSENPYVRQR